MFYFPTVLVVSLTYFISFSFYIKSQPHPVELRWLDDAIEWVDMMGYTIAAIDEISFRQPDNSWHSFTSEEIEETITRFLSGA